MSDNSINNTKDIDYKKIEKLDFDDELDIIFYKTVTVDELRPDRNVVNIISSTYENGKKIEALFDIKEFQTLFLSELFEDTSCGISYVVSSVEISLIKNILQSLLKTNTNTKVLDSCNFILALIQEEKVDILSRLKRMRFGNQRD